MMFGIGPDMGAVPATARCYITAQPADRWHRLNDRSRVPVSELGASIIAAEKGRLAWRDALKARPW